MVFVCCGPRLIRTSGIIVMYVYCDMHMGGPWRVARMESTEHSMWSNELDDKKKADIHEIMGWSAPVVSLGSLSMHHVWWPCVQRSPFSTSTLSYHPHHWVNNTHGTIWVANLSFFHLLTVPPSKLGPIPIPLASPILPIIQADNLICPCWIEAMHTCQNPTSQSPLEPHNKPSQTSIPTKKQPKKSSILPHPSQE